MHSCPTSFAGALAFTAVVLLSGAKTRGASRFE